jgi:hypothetical protein
MKLTLPAASAARAEQLLAKRLPTPAPIPAPKPAKAKPGKATAAPAAKPAKAKAPVEPQTKAKPGKATPAPQVEPIAPEPELTEEERAKRRRQAAELNARYEARQRRIQGIAKVEADARELWPNAFRDPPVPLAVGFAAAFMGL